MSTSHSPFKLFACDICGKTGLYVPSEFPSIPAPSTCQKCVLRGLRLMEQGERILADYLEEVGRRHEYHLQAGIAAG